MPWPGHGGATGAAAAADTIPTIITDATIWLGSADKHSLTSLIKNEN